MARCAPEVVAAAAVRLPVQWPRALGAALVVVSLSGCGQAGAVGKAEPHAESVSPDPDRPARSGAALEGRRVEVAVVQPSSEMLQLEVPGEVEGYRDAWLAPPLGGYVERVLVEEGRRVQEGAALIHVDRKMHALREDRVRLQLEVAAREHERALNLGTSIPTAEVDAARDRVSLAEADLRELSLNTERAVLRAPFSGVVVELDAEVGEVAPPGAPLIRLVQLDPIKISVALSDRDMALAKRGAPAHVSLDARSGVYEGKVTALAQAANLKTRAFEATVELPNPEGELLPGMIASVSLRSDTDASKEKSLVVAQDWLVTRRDGVGVFIEVDGKARWRDVELGDILRRQVVVESGIEAGDALIIVGHRDLVEGDPVLVHRRGKCCTEGRATFR